MESSGQRPAEPEVPLADAAIATEIARAAARGRGADRAPTLDQLLAAFGETQPTFEARRRVRAALEVAGMGVRPDLLNAEPGERLMLLPPGVSSGPSRGRAAAGIVALIAILVVAGGVAALVGGGDDKNASDDLPATATSGQSASAGGAPSSAAPASTQTQAATQTATTPTATTPAATTKTETTPAADTPAEIKAKRHKRAVRIRTERAAREKAALANKVVTVRVDASVRPTFLCVDDGAGKQLFGGTLTGKQTFKGKRVRLNIGLASTRVTVNGNPVRLDGSPSGLDVTRKGGARQLPSGHRPCG
ncbi:MAG TPA: hypothetical protein VGM33_08880 [Baekduia sp.]|jgi:hypothetical protein